MNRALLILVLFLSILCFTNVSAKNSIKYINSNNKFTIFTDTFGKYSSIDDMKSLGYKFYYFYGEIKDNALYGEYKGDSVNHNDETFVLIPYSIRLGKQKIKFSLTARLIEKGDKNTINWIIMEISGGYKYNYGIGDAITFYHSPKDKITYFIANGSISYVNDANHNIPINVTHTYTLEFNATTIDVYVDNKYVTTFNRGNSLTNISFAIMYEDNQCEVYYYNVSISPKSFITVL